MTESDRSHDAPRVSVVIPCFNQSTLLPRAIDSCLGQTYSSVEVIVVDDGSPDDVAAVVRSYGSRVRFVRRENGGLGAARNTGLEVARGEFVKFLDADDWLLPSCIELQVAALSGLGRYIALIGWEWQDDEAPSWRRQVFPSFSRLLHRVCYGSPAAAHTVLFRADDLRAIGGYEPREWAEDYDILCRFAAAGFEAVSIHSIGCVYRWTASSMSKSRERLARSTSRVWLAHAERVLDLGADDETAIHLLAGMAHMVHIDPSFERYTPALERLAAQLGVRATRSSASLRRLLVGVADLVALAHNAERSRGRWLELLGRIALAATASATCDPEHYPRGELLTAAEGFLRERRADLTRRLVRNVLAVPGPEHGALALMLLSVVSPRIGAAAWRALRSVRTPSVVPSGPATDA